MRFRSVSQYLLFLPFLFCASLPAQTTFATITGVVTDSSGALIPNATITAINKDTGATFTAKSNAAGNYTIGQLKNGRYDVSAEAAGFKKYLAKDVVLLARDDRRLNISMEIGTVEVTMEVHGGATLIETESARIDMTKTAEHMKKMPLNTRAMYPFLAQTPGVLAGNSGALRIAGSDVNQSHLAIDGTTFDDGVGNFIGPFGNYTEWMQELKVDIANNTAEFGPLGHITVISKSGTNQFHGSAFDYYSSPVFRARNPFALARGTGVFHLYGGSIGGPVLLPKLYNGRNRTFFFTSLESSIGGQSTTLLNPTVPLEAWRHGDFSSLLPAIHIYNPKTGRPFDRNIIPASELNTTSLAIQERFYPQPNFGNTSSLQNQNFRLNVTRPWDPSTNSTTRIDHRLSDQDSIFGRFSFQRGFNRTFEGNLPTIGRRSQQRDNRAASISYTRIINPTVVNEFRWGYAYNLNPFSGPINGPAIVQQFGLAGLAPDLPDVPGLPTISFSGLGTQVQGISQVPWNAFGGRSHLEEFQEHLNWSRGRHDLKFGFDLTRIAFDDLQASAAGNLFGSLQFSNFYTSGGIAGQGNSYADFLLGIPTSASRSFPPIETNQRRWQYDFFFQDNFKVNRKLTLNYGIRYELHLPWRETHGFMSMFDIGTGKIVVPDSSLSKISPLFPTNFVGIIGASKAGLPQTLIRADKNNFAPRIGLAYRPFGENTVFRAGWGMYYDIAPQAGNIGGIPFVVAEPSFTNPAPTPMVVLPQVFPGGGVGGPASVGLPGARNPDLKIPYSMQYSFTIEHQRWGTGFSASYVGTATRHGQWSYDFNAPLPSTTPYINKPRPFPNYPGIPYLTNGAGQQYNALMTVVQRRMSKGLMVQGSWTWARAIFDVGRGDSAIENPFNRKRERAVVPDIPTHRVVAGWVYQLPFGKGRQWFSGAPRAVNALLGGWDISGALATHSGQFLTPLWTGRDPTNTVFTTSATPAQVTIRPDQLRDPNLPDGVRSVSRWFDAGAFGSPAPGRFGTSAKGVIKGPGLVNLSIGLYKEVRFWEGRFRVIPELTATNVLNHPNYSNPIVNITQNAGVISNVGGVSGGSTGDQPGSRQLRAGLRVEF